jgi:hypothetical protein
MVDPRSPALERPADRLAEKLIPSKGMSVLAVAAFDARRPKKGKWNICDLSYPR